MTLTIEVAPEVERALQEPAQANGQSVAEYAAALLTYAAQVHPCITDAGQRLEIATRLAALDAIPIYNTRAGLPPLQDEAEEGISRADFYGYTKREDAIT